MYITTLEMSFLACILGLLGGAISTVVFVRDRWLNIKIGRLCGSMSLCFTISLGSVFLVCLSFWLIRLLNDGRGGFYFQDFFIVCFLRYCLLGQLLALDGFTGVGSDS